MEEYVKKGISSEVKQLYQLGLEQDIDFLNLEHRLYRKYHSDWKKLKNKIPYYVKYKFEQIVSFRKKGCPYL